MRATCVGRSHAVRTCSAHAVRTSECACIGCEATHPARGRKSPGTQEMHGSCFSSCCEIRVFFARSRPSERSAAGTTPGSATRCRDEEHREGYNQQRVRTDVWGRHGGGGGGGGRGRPRDTNLPPWRASTCEAPSPPTCAPP